MQAAPQPGAAWPSSFVDGDRLWRRLADLARFGATPKGGVNRQALSIEEIEARAALVGWGRDIGLETASDPIANLFLTLPGAEPDAPPVMVGSHIDSQPTGGKFDGAYGVVAGLEALQAIAESAARPRRPVTLVAWTNEEGSRFAPGMMGSEAFTGRRSLEKILAAQDAQGISVAEAVETVRQAEPDIPEQQLGASLHAFVEAHIEQGPVLERQDKTIGVVTGIQGTRRYRVRVTGEEAHAGTTTREERRDALSAAVRMVAALEAATVEPRDLKFTIGLFQVKPNAPSVVPSEVYFSIDLRYPDNDLLSQLGESLSDICRENRGPCDVEVREIAHAPSLAFPEAMQARIAGASERLGVPSMELFSAAGHDARHLHYVCPTGMIFIPCKDGISHNEAEDITCHDAVAGARVLADVLWELANE